MEWTRKTYDAAGLTQHPLGEHLVALQRLLGGSVLRCPDGMSVYEHVIWAIENEAISELRALLTNKSVWKVRNFDKNQLPNPMQAALNGCGQDKVTPVFQMLVQNRFQFDEQDEHGWRPLVGAVLLGNVNAARLFLESGASIEWNTTDDFSHTWMSALHALPFMPASVGGFETMVDLLMERGAKLNPVHGVPPLHGVVNFAFRTGPDVCNSRIESLISRGANINHRGALPFGLMPVPFYGRPLHAYYGSGRKVVEKLLELGADANLTDSSGRNAEEFFLAYREKSRGERDELEAILAMLRKKRKAG